MQSASVVLEVVGALVRLVELVDLVNPLLLDEGPHRPAVHQLHQVGFEVVVGEPKVEVQLGVFLHFLDQVARDVLLQLGTVTQPLSLDVLLLLFVLGQVIWLIFFCQSQCQLNFSIP